ncbi:asparagine synthase-related protein [Natranaerobius trueperi]|uniref:asparagine synthase (glutamine-hydrolyzing) n=1 Tax=Natranaerobius trueperi TaxID=759412 RepID=A0A226C0J7_9FIRM|nr:asparagine synthase-related protein [Natranaerobius trueperi]OWZ84756.1 asparagine synthase [Natranaerobius trueperi]
MSGIVGVQGKFQTKKLEGILEKLEHRGPDGKRLYPNGNLALGEVTSQYELSLARENIYNSVLVLDGTPSYQGAKLSREELFNFYLDNGPNIFKLLEDDFAIILTDGDKLVVARDIFGTRPLYYCKVQEGLVFASEIKALKELDAEIKVFPPGTYYTTSDGFNRFKSVPEFNDDIEDSPGSARYYQKAEELNSLIEKAVKKNISENTRIGVFLSGGVDSSVIAAALSNVKKAPIQTFAVGMKDCDDVLNARKVSEYINSEHYELTYESQDMIDALPEVIYHLESFDVELVNSSIANYLVSKIAKEKGIELVLSGEGADELFGGYHHLKQYETNEELNRELELLLKGMHSGGLQRVDRMTKAHALNCQMPFFDSEIIEFARILPYRWKISDSGMEKVILRQAFNGMLPDEVLWRKKSQFGIGSGNEDAMTNIINAQVTDKELRMAKENYGINFKSKAEYYYYKIFKEFYPDKVESMVNRWLA